MKEFKSIQKHLHSKIESLETLLLDLDKMCCALNNPEIAASFNGALNEININIQIIRRANLDSYEYEKLNGILKQMEKIKDLMQEQVEIQALICHIVDNLVRIRKDLYFAPHLSAALEDSVEAERQAAKRQLTQLVTALGQIYMDDLEERITKQQQAVVETYKKITQSSSPSTTRSVFNNKSKLIVLLEKFIDAEIEHQKKEKKAPHLARPGSK